MQESEVEQEATGLTKRLRDGALVAGAEVLSRVVPRILSLEAAQSIGGRLGSLAYRFPHKRRERLRSHLSIAFPDPAYDADFRDRLARESYESMANMLMEGLWIPAWKDERDNNRVRIVDRERWDETLRLAKERGRGLVVFAAHFGGIEVVSRWLPQALGMPVMAIADQPNLAGIERPLRRMREGGGVKVVYRGQAGVAAFRHLRAGGALAMLVDHNLEGEGVGVKFFGQNAHTLLAPARLALQAGAVANTFFCIREGRGRFQVFCGRPMVLPPPAKDKQERFRQEAELTRQYTKRIEKMIRKYPGQYLWMHRRWQKRSDTLSYTP